MIYLWKMLSIFKTFSEAEHNRYALTRRSKRKYFATSMTTMFAQTDAKRSGAARPRSVGTSRKRFANGSNDSARARPVSAKQVEPRRYQFEKNLIERIDERRSLNANDVSTVPSVSAMKVSVRASGAGSDQ